MRQGREASPSLTRWLLGLGLAIAAVTILVYAPVRHFDFVQLDDPLYVAENAHVTTGLRWPNVQWAFSTIHGGYWIPLTWLSYMLDVELFGVAPGALHATNVALHALNAILLFALVFRITGAWGRAAFVAALFAVHPLRVESVAWITERKDVLSTLFMLAAIWAYVAYARRPAFTRYAALVLLFVLGLMAKPMVVTLPFVLLLLDYWPLGRLRGGPGPEGGRAAGSQMDAVALLREKVPLFAIAGIAGVGTIISQGHAVATLDAMPLGARLHHAVVGSAAYIGKTLWPSGLSPVYLPPATISFRDVLIPGLVLVLVSVLVVRARRAKPYLLVGWLWYLGTLLPVSGLVQSGVQMMADRFTYVPLVGLFLMIAWGVPDLVAGRKALRPAVAAGAALAIVACAVLARVQVGYWKDSVTFWTRATEMTLGLDRYHTHLSLGDVLLQQGRGEEAVGHFTEAVKLQPETAAAHHRLGLAQAALGRTDLAASSLGEAVRLDPTLAEAHSDLGLLLSQQGRLQDALPHLRQAVGLKPGLAQAQANLGALLLDQQRYVEALPSLTAAARLQPGSDAARIALGVALARLGRLDEAIAEFEQALRINPGNAVARRARDELAAARAKAAGGGVPAR